MAGAAWLVSGGTRIAIHESSWGVPALRQIPASRGIGTEALRWAVVTLLPGGVPETPHHWGDVVSRTPFL